MDFEIETIEPRQLPSLPLAKRLQLPKCSAVYFALSPSDEVLYIGQTKSLGRRWQHHQREPQLPRDARIAWIETINSELHTEIERVFIKRFNPPMNRSPLPRNGDKVTLATIVPLNIAEAINEIAEQENRSVSQVIHLLLREALKTRLKAL